MGKCVVKTCDSASHSQNKESGITFHTIPTDEVRRQKWINIIRLLIRETDWLPTKQTTICSRHFREQDKKKTKTGGGRTLLSNEAVPVLDNESDFERQIEAPEVKNMDTDAIDVEELVESDTDSDETNELTKMDKMRRTIKRLRLVSTKQRKKLNNLREKNKRLTKNNEKLKEIVDKLINLKTNTKNCACVTNAAEACSDAVKT